MRQRSTIFTFLIFIFIVWASPLSLAQSTADNTSMGRGSPSTQPSLTNTRTSLVETWVSKNATYALSSNNLYHQPLPAFLTGEEGLHLNSFAFHTAEGPKGGYATIDLKRPYPISKVWIEFRRGSGFERRAVGLSVWLSNTSGQKGDKIWTAEHFAPEWTVLVQNVSARYVTIGLPDTLAEPLHLAHAKVFAMLPTTANASNATPVTYTNSIPPNEDSRPQPDILTPRSATDDTMSVTAAEIKERRQQMLVPVKKQIASLDSLLDQLPADAKAGSDLNGRLLSMKTEQARIEAMPDMALANEIIAERQKAAAVAESERAQAEVAKAENERERAEQAKEAGDGTPRGVADGFLNLLIERKTLRSAQFVDYFQPGGFSQWNDMPQGVSDIAIHYNFEFITEAGFIRDNQGYVVLHLAGGWHPVVVNIDGTDYPAKVLRDGGFVIRN